MISALLLAATPAPPLPITRQTGLPEYTAQCLVVGRDGRTVKLGVVVRGQASLGVEIPSLSPRTIRLSSKAQEFRSLNNLIVRTASSISNVGWTKRWETSDYGQASIGKQSVSIKLVSEDDLTKGIGIEIQERGQMTIPFYAGMCTAKTIEKKPAQ